MNGPVLHALEGLAVGFALCVRPGPAITITIRNAGRGQTLAGPAAFTGRVVADLLPLAGVGALAVSRVAPGLPGGVPGTLLGAAAGLVLGFLGWRLMDDRTSGAVHRDRGAELVRSFSRHAVLDRLLASLASPAWHLFWWTAGLWLVLDCSSAGPAGIGSLAAGVAAAGLGWHLFVALRLRAPGRERALSDRQYRILSSLTGLAVVAVGSRALVLGLADSGIREALERVMTVVFG